MEQMKMNKVFKDSNDRLLDGINELAANVSVLNKSVLSIKRDILDIIEKGVTKELHNDDISRGIVVKKCYRASDEGLRKSDDYTCDIEEYEVSSCSAKDIKTSKPKIVYGDGVISYMV